MNAVSPWQGFGKRLPAGLSAEQALEHAGLNWEVQKYPLSYERQGQKLFIKKSALLRETDGAVLDEAVGRGWSPLQNKDAFDFFHEFVKAGGMEMHTAGGLKNGQFVWVLAKINESFELFNGDKIESYLLLTNPHKFGHSIDVRFTPVRVISQTSLSMALHSVQSAESFVRTSHVQKFDSEKVKDILIFARERLEQYRQYSEILGSTPAKIEEVKKYLDLLFPAAEEKNGPSRNAEKVFDLILTQPGNKFAEGSWWQPFNAVTYFADHVYGRSQENRLAAAWYGSNRDLKNKALQLAVDFALATPTA